MHPGKPPIRNQRQKPSRVEVAKSKRAFLFNAADTMTHEATGISEQAAVGIVEEHTTVLSALLTALLDRLVAAEADPTSNAETIAQHICSLAEEHKTKSPELLDRVLQKAVVDVLKGGICEPPRPNAGLRTALAVVDVAIVLVRMRQIDEKLPCTLLEFVFTFCTRKQLASSVFLIRDRFVAYRAASPSSLINVFMIKTAMSCINRDQKGSDPALSGRLQLMLAAALPVWHPSGLNRRAQFNTANEVEYNTALKEADSSEVDAALFKAFWGVQGFMRNPSLAESREAWSEARSAMDTIVSAFETLPCPGNVPVVHSNSNPKYMTSGSILRLQLVDIRVRRHVLVQYAIFLHHLELMGASAKSDRDAPGTEVRAKFCRSLFEQDGEGEQMKTRIFRLLEKESAGKFKKFILSVLQRERRWIDWKKGKGYKHLETGSKEIPKTFKRRTVLAPVPEVKASSNKKRRIQVADEDWERRQSSWDILPPGERMKPLKDPERCPVPAVEEVREQLLEDMNDTDITIDLKRKNDNKYVWRTLRMLLDESLDTLSKVIDVNAKGGHDLEKWVKEGHNAPLTSGPEADAFKQKEIA